MNTSPASPHALFGIALGGATVAWIPVVDLALRWSAAATAIASGIAGFVYYGKRNGWWK